MKTKQLLLVSLIASTTLLAGCANVSKVPIMGAIGGVIGKSVGGDSRAIIIGTLVGGAIGLMMDKQEAALKDAFTDEIRAGNVEVIREGDTIRVIQSARTAFEVGSYEMSPRFTGSLHKTASIFNDFPDTQIMIDGHASSEGAELYNFELSRNRALYVKLALKQLGITESRMTHRGFGELRPRASNSTAAGRHLNRRVEMVISPYAANAGDLEG